MKFIGRKKAFVMSLFSFFFLFFIVILHTQSNLFYLKNVEVKKLDYMMTFSYIDFFNNYIEKASIQSAKLAINEIIKKEMVVMPAPNKDSQGNQIYAFPENPGLGNCGFFSFNGSSFPSPYNGKVFLSLFRDCFAGTLSYCKNISFTNNLEKMINNSNIAYNLNITYSIPKESIFIKQDKNYFSLTLTFNISYKIKTHSTSLVKNKTLSIEVPIEGLYDPLYLVTRSCSPNALQVIKFTKIDFSRDENKLFDNFKVMLNNSEYAPVPKGLGVSYWSRLFGNISSFSNDNFPIVSFVTDLDAPKENISYADYTFYLEKEFSFADLKCLTPLGEAALIDTGIISNNLTIHSTLLSNFVIDSGTYFTTCGSPG